MRFNHNSPQKEYAEIRSQAHSGMFNLAIAFVLFSATVRFDPGIVIATVCGTLPGVHYFSGLINRSEPVRRFAQIRRMPTLPAAVLAMMIGVLILLQVATLAIVGPWAAAALLTPVCAIGFLIVRKKAA